MMLLLGKPQTSRKNTSVMKQDYTTCYMLQFSSVQSLSHVQLFATARTAAYQVSLSITNSWSSLKLISIESVMPSNRLILHRPLSSCLQSFPASRCFPMNRLFTSGDQSTGGSTSFLPINIQDWFPLGLTGLISLVKTLTSLGRGRSKTHLTFILPGTYQVLGDPNWEAWRNSVICSLSMYL